MKLIFNWGSKYSLVDLNSELKNRIQDLLRHSKQSKYT